MKNWTPSAAGSRLLSEEEAGELARLWLEQARGGGQTHATKRTIRGRAVLIGAVRRCIPATLRRVPELGLVAALVAYNLGGAIAHFI